MSDDTFTARLASRILEDAGTGAIWKLHLAAAEAHRGGCPLAAAAILKVAEAAEENQLRLGTKSFLNL
jgi:hypothetical protein